MTRTEMNVFRRLLETEQAELGNGNRNRAALAIETSPDDLDRIQNSQERDYAMGNLERNSSRLREVHAALRRIDGGTFGICAGCDEDINPKRLSAVPWASFCIVCRDAEDRGQSMLESGIETSIDMAA